jgi:hypothetical protein
MSNYSRLSYHQINNQLHLLDNKVQFIVKNLHEQIFIPRSEEHPGPPFNQRVTGSLLLLPFTD